MSTPESITRDELAEAMARLGNPAGQCDADAIFACIAANGEPAPETGSIYQDADGDVYKYCNNLAGDTPWLGFTGELYASGYVSRPLRKLVPETPRPDHAAVLAEIEAWASQGCGLRNLADRICKMIGVSDEH